MLRDRQGGHCELHSPGSQGFRPTVSVVICALNEEESLPHVLTRIPDFVTEVILVDGRSSDGTVEVARKVRPDIKVIVQPGKGKGEALRLGFKEASGDIIVTLDADGTTDPLEMQNMVSPLLQGYDLVKGSRFRKGLPQKMPKHRIFGNIVLAAFASLLFLRPLTDICSGYLAFWKKSLDRLDFLNSGRPTDVESAIILRAIKRGLRIKEVGHVDRGRIAGESKMPSLREGWNNIK
ncbi:MAG: glycosyltransferase family 2 protein, partial [Dehalococcoidia bacterium]|nr:glycosyltransferase family 2 protein [Dehalococcoidia bacterium]